MRNKKLIIFLALTLLILVPISSQAFRVVIDDNDPTNALGIRNLRVGDVFFNVAFLFDSANDIWGSAPAPFDFPTVVTAVAAGATAGEALDTLPDIVTVGPDMEGHFRIPYERLLGDNLLSDDQIYDLRGDENWSGQGNTWTESETLTYAKFTVVPIPAAVWLLGGGLIGLLGLRRRLKKE